MHKVLEEIIASLDSLSESIEESITTDQSFGIHAKNWSFPGIDKYEIISFIDDISTKIKTFGGDSLGDNESTISEYPAIIEFIEQSLIPNFSGNLYQGSSTIIMTLQMLDRALITAFHTDPLKEATNSIRSLQTRIRSREAQLNGVEPRVDESETMVERIKDAFESADRLPTDLESLSEARRKIDILENASSTDRAKIEAILNEVNNSKLNIDQSKTEAQAVLEKCQTAYRAATSVGLAAAFSERSNALSNSMWAWVVGLIVALGAAGLLGHQRIEALSTLISDDASLRIVVLNIVSSALAVGAPIWFAWLATKQVGQRFRLSEDYAFKASVSRAYEGYRREASRFGEDLEIKLLTSALARIDELPLRLVESNSHGSPAHELISSDPVITATRLVPDFFEQVRELARTATAKVQARTSAKTATRDEADEDEVS